LGGVFYACICLFLCVIRVSLMSSCFIIGWCVLRVYLFVSMCNACFAHVFVFYNWV
jgi:hypothetical protein